MMLRKDNHEPWDELRLLDFGFAQIRRYGTSVLISGFRLHSLDLVATTMQQADVTALLHMFGIHLN